MGDARKGAPVLHHQPLQGLDHECSKPCRSDDHSTTGTVFTLLTLNVQQVNFDAAYGTRTEWKKMLVGSTFSLSLLTGMSVRTVSAEVVANLGRDQVKATHPVFVGDTLHAKSTMLNKRESKSRPIPGHRHRVHVRDQPGRDLACYP